MASASILLTSLVVCRAGEAGPVVPAGGQVGDGEIVAIALAGTFILLPTTPHNDNTIQYTDYTI